MKCDKCGKDMTSPGGGNTIGLRTTIMGPGPNVDDRRDEEHYRKQIGKYELNREYCFCWECWLDSLFNN